MVYETIDDEDVLEVQDVRGWRSVYAVTKPSPSEPPMKIEPSIVVDLDFDEEITQIRRPPADLLTVTSCR
jgi:hypothetical protein